jgi:hypothetical protein
MVGLSSPPTLAWCHPISRESRNPEFSNGCWTNGAGLAGDWLTIGTRKSPAADVARGRGPGRKRNGIACPGSCLGTFQVRQPQPGAMPGLAGNAWNGRGMLGSQGVTCAQCYPPKLWITRSGRPPPSWRRPCPTMPRQPRRSPPRGRPPNRTRTRIVPWTGRAAQPRRPEACFPASGSRPSPLNDRCSANSSTDRTRFTAHVPCRHIQSEPMSGPSICQLRPFARPCGHRA